jgi:hypothetical protein
MSELLLLGILLLALVAGIGLPYRQSWYSRWNPE